MLIFFIELGPGPRWAQTYPFKDTISLSLERLQFLKQLCIVHNFKPCFFKKRMDGVLGIRTRGRGMVGADKTTELWRPP